MSDDKVPITPQGHQKLKDELKRLRSIEMPEIVKAIEVARDHGDLSENADYDAAKNRQGQIVSRMIAIEDKIARAQIIDPSTLDHDKIVFGATVKLLDVETDEKLEYQIVGADESDVKQGKISVQSPIARSLIGKKVEDVVKIITPKGSRELEVLEINFK